MLGWLIIRLGVAATSLSLLCAGCGSAGPTPRGSGRPVRLTVRLDDSHAALRVARGVPVIAVFPHNPLGRWTRPTVHPPGIADVTADRSARGMTVRIVARRQGAAVVEVHTIPSGELRPPGTAPYAHWRLELTVTP